MQMLFTRIPYAVTLSEGELVDTDYTGSAVLVCKFCGIRVSLATGPDGTKGYKHWLTSSVATCRASTCKYRHFLIGGWQPYHALKPLGHAMGVPARARNGCLRPSLSVNGVASCAITGITAANSASTVVTGLAPYLHISPYPPITTI